MIKIFNRLFAILFLFGWMPSVAVQAQDSNPVLSFGADVRSAGMGDILLPHSGAPLIHSNPTQIFRQEERLHAGYIFGLTRKETPRTGTQGYHALSVGYRLGQKHAIFGGVRYWSGSKVDYYNSIGTKMGELYPADVTVDVGYAYKTCSHFSVFSTLTYLNTYSSRTGHALAMSVGANFNAQISGLKSGAYGVTLSLSNVGTQIMYPKAKDIRRHLPSVLGVSSGMSMGAFGDHIVTIGGMYRFQFLPSTKHIHTISGGVEYAMPTLFSLRIGGQYEADNSHMTFGVGRRFGAFGIDFAYSAGMRPEFNLFRAGVTLSI